MTRAGLFGCEVCRYLRDHAVPRRILWMHHLRHHWRRPILGGRS